MYLDNSSQSYTPCDSILVSKITKGVGSEQISESKREWNEGRMSDVSMPWAGLPFQCHPRRTRHTGILYETTSTHQLCQLDYWWNVCDQNASKSWKSSTRTRTTYHSGDLAICSRYFHSFHLFLRVHGVSISNYFVHPCIDNTFCMTFNELLRLDSHCFISLTRFFQSVTRLYLLNWLMVSGWTNFSLFFSSHNMF